MSVTSAMYTVISGLTANSEAMSVIGNNLANVNTVGYKQSRALFADMLSTSIDKGQLGRGERIQSVETLFSQASFESTGSATDLAIQGDGLFVLQNPAGNGRFFSRAGTFDFDKNKILTNPDGFQVLGFGISDDVSNGALGPINLSLFANQAPKATTGIDLLANLDATQGVKANAWDPTDPNFNPVTASNYSTSTVAYDSLGNTKSTTLYFRKTAANAWDVYSSDGSNYSPAGAVPGIPITFDPVKGTLATVNGQPTVDALGKPVDPAPTLSLGGLNVDLGATTQFTSASIIFSQNQDGYAAGNLMKISVDDKGFVNAVYSNGQQKKVAQVALAKFAALSGLEKVGGNLYQATTTSGEALINDAMTLGNKIFSNSLEQSNVDMATELVKMITTQRAYSANSKTMTTADDMLQETLNLKR